MVCRYLAIRKDMIGIDMKQWNALEKWAISLILVNALSRLNVVSLKTCTLQE